MSLRTEFLRVMAERRRHAPGSPDHTYRTRAARTLLWMLRGVPAAEWRHE